MFSSFLEELQEKERLRTRTAKEPANRNRRTHLSFLKESILSPELSNNKFIYVSLAKAPKVQHTLRNSVKVNADYRLTESKFAGSPAADSKVALVMNDFKRKKKIKGEMSHKIAQRENIRVKRRLCVDEINQRAQQKNRSNCLLDWIKLRVGPEPRLPNSGLEKLKIINVLDINHSRLITGFKTRTPSQSEEFDTRGQDKQTLFKQFIEFVKMCLVNDMDSLRNLCKLKLSHRCYIYLREALVCLLKEYLSANEVVCLKQSLEQYKSILHPTNLLEEIGGVGFMKEIFKVLYGKVESDEFLAHLVKPHADEKDSVEKCFYYFLMEDFDILERKLHEFHEKITLHEFYLIKEKLWQTFRDRISITITTKLLENLQRLFKKVVLRKPFYEVKMEAVPSKYRVCTFRNALVACPLDDVHHQELLWMKFRWVEELEENSMEIMQQQEKVQLSKVLLEVQQYLADSDFLKHYPQEIQNLMYVSEEYSGLQLFEYLLQCLFARANCIEPSEIRLCLTNQKISEFVPYLWIQGLDYAYTSMSKAQKAELPHFRAWIDIVREMFQAWGLYVQFKKE